MRQFHIDLLLHFQIEFANLKHQMSNLKSWVLYPARITRCSSVDLVKDHEQIEQRQIDHRRVKETFGRDLRRRYRSLISEGVKANAENYRRHQIELSRVR